MGACSFVMAPIPPNSTEHFENNSWKRKTRARPLKSAEKTEAQKYKCAERKQRQKHRKRQKTTVEADNWTKLITKIPSPDPKSVAQEMPTCLENNYQPVCELLGSHASQDPSSSGPDGADRAGGYHPVEYIGTF